MIKNCLLKIVKYLLSSILISFVFVLFFNTKVSAGTLENISFQGKIVRNDTGHEGMNIVTGTPACVLAGADTCDFQVSYYTAETGGTLLFSEKFLNVEIGDYGGVFDLTLGTGTYVAGSSLWEAINEGLDGYAGDLYIQVGFSPAGNDSYTETFSRMPMGGSAFSFYSATAFHAYGDGYNGFIFNPIASNPTSATGKVYFNSGTKTLKLYDGTAWVDIALGTIGSSVWGEGNLTPFTYAQYMESTGIGTFGSFTVDTDEQRVSVKGAGIKSGLTVYSSYNVSDAANTYPLASFKADGPLFAGTILSLIQDGTGKLLTGYKGSDLEFEFDNRGDLHLNTDGMLYIEPFSSAPSSYHPNSGEGCVYTYGGDIYWDPACNGTRQILNGGTATSLWTDAGTFSYLTSITDDLILGGSTIADATFFFDVDGSSGSYFEIDNAANSSRLFTVASDGNVGIGVANPSAKLDIGGAASVISNTTGDITITPTANTIFSSGNVGIGTASPLGKLHIKGTADEKQLVIQANSTQTLPLILALDSSGGELFRIHSNGSNLFMGQSVGASISTGAGNTAMGYYSLTANTTGNFNTAFGEYSLESNTTGLVNTGIGMQALEFNTTGGYNTGLGYFAGAWASTGGTLYNETGTYSLYLGANTKPLADAQTNQIVIGYNAVGNGSNSVVLGNDSITTTILKGKIGIGTTNPSNLLEVFDLISFSNANSRTQIGYQAGKYDLGQYNTWIGYQSGSANNATGKTNAADYNTAIGYRSLYSNTTAENNTAVGSSALYLNSTGVQNTAVGANALYNNTSNSNTAVGYTSLAANLGGAGNIAMGHSSLRLNTSGSLNVAIGYEALYNNTTASYNVAIGQVAGKFIANGTTANSTGSQSIFLGSSTKALANAQTNQIVIGYDATGVGSNSVVLGNDSITKTILKGYVGIGTADPLKPLHLKTTSGEAFEYEGNHTIGVRMRFNPTATGGRMWDIGATADGATGEGGGGKFMIRDGTGSNTPFVIDSSGRVGIGNVSPSATLDVNGNINIADGSSGTPAFAFSSDTNTGFYRGGADILTFVANGQNAMGIYGASGVGRLAIGDGTPVSRIQIFDDNNNTASGITFGASSGTYMQLYKSASNKLSLTGGSFGIGATPSIDLAIGDTDTGLKWISDGNLAVMTNNVERMRIASNGSVSISSSTAGPTLNVGRLSGQANIKSSADWLIMDSNTSPAALNYFSAQPVLLAYGGGSVGIGTNTTTNKLNVAGNIDITAGEYRLYNKRALTYETTPNTMHVNPFGDFSTLFFNTNCTTCYSTFTGFVGINQSSGTGYGLKVANTASAMSQYYNVVNIEVADQTGSDYEYFLIMNRTGATPDTEFRFATSGKGFSDGGWTTPADYAEYFETNDTSLDKGHLVSLDPQNEHLVKFASSTNRGQLFGVVSTKPGIVGAYVDDVTEDTEAMDNSPRFKIVGILGQVPTYVTNENGPINYGDPITISSIPGVGAKAVTAGHIVGRAMESYNSSIPGKIRVLVQASWYDPNASSNSASVINLLPGRVNALEASTASLQTQINNLKAQVLAINTGSGATLPLNADGILARMNIESNTLKITGDIEVLGKSTFRDIDVGSIALANNSISIKGTTCIDEEGKANLALCEINTLYIQKDKSGNVNFFNGGIVLDPTGKITAGQLEIKEESQTIGSGTILTGESSVVITSKKITNNSKIFVTATNNTNGQNIYVSTKTVGESFTVSIQQPITTDITFDWFVVNSVPVDNI